MFVFFVFFSFILLPLDLYGISVVLCFFLLHIIASIWYDGDFFHIAQTFGGIRGTRITCKYTQRENFYIHSNRWFGQIYHCPILFQRISYKLVHVHVASLILRIHNSYI